MKLFSLLLFAFTLTACAGGTNDPAVGKSELIKLNRWEQNTNIESEIEAALNRTNPQTDERFNQVVKNTVKQRVEKEKQGLKALNLQHREVRKLAKLYEEMLNLTPQMYDAFLANNEKQSVMLQNQMNKLLQQTSLLEKQLKQRFL